MKKKLVLFCLIGTLLLMNIRTYAQVGINSVNIPPDSSAGLDVNFTDKGFLPPRMTLLERNAIVNPANGLIVICTDCDTMGSVSVFFSESGWITLTPCSTPAPVPLTHFPTGNSINWNWNAVEGAIGYKWNDTNNYTTATDIGLVCSLTENGLKCNTAFYRYIWAYFSCGTSAVTVLLQSTSLTALNPPIAGTHVTSSGQIVWKWNQVENATGYKWNTTNHFSTDSLAIDVGNNTSYTETGLTNSNTYTRYVWAYNSCNVSQPDTLIQSLFFPGMAYQGGIIFYIYQPGDHGYVAGETHGLIAAYFDQDDLTDWGCQGIQWIGGTSELIGYGRSSTEAIVNGCSEPDIAASVCYDLYLNGYNDWFLPTSAELLKLFDQRYIVQGFTNINTGWYWSASEYVEMGGLGYALAVNMVTGITSYWQKYYPYAVRPVRAF